jgi:sulfatase maturation enzyme AslB (radical SAM superfamily)
VKHLESSKEKRERNSCWYMMSVWLYNSIVGFEMLMKAIVVGIQRYRGWIDLIGKDRAAGWVWNPRNPRERLNVVIRHGDTDLAETAANYHRPDLTTAGIGDGHYSFDVRWVHPLPDHALSSIRAVVKGSEYCLPVSETAIEAGHSLDCEPEACTSRDCQVSVHNVARLLSDQPSTFRAILFDPVDDCNLRCVYCHNARSEHTVSTVDFERFINQMVIATDFFQIGCAMEPTLDSRLCDLMMLVATSPARPKVEFSLQTNGILLHRHDYAKMKDAGLDNLQVSLDTGDKEILSSLRSGTSLQKVLRNVGEFRRHCPDIKITFIATVTRENILSIEHLVSLGLDLGVSNFVFREVFYNPNNHIVDHLRMPDLLLKEEEFRAMRVSLINRFRDNANFVFADQKALRRSETKMLSDSLHGR